MSDDIPEGQINMPPQPKSGFEAFKGTPLAIIIGAILAIAMTIAMFYTGMYAGCCGLGFFLVALILYYIPKIFGTKKLYQSIAIGVAFFLIVTAFGTFVVSKDIVNNNTVVSGDDLGNDWKDIVIDTDNDTITITYAGDKYKPEENSAYLVVVSVSKICYNNIVDGSDVEYIQGIAGADNTFTFTKSGYFEKNKLYDIAFALYKNKEVEGHNERGDIVDNSRSYSKLIKNHLSDDELRNIMLRGNAYWVGICAVCYFVLVALMYFMNLYLDKTRARLEAEGRLYPQGYGRCKECGTIVLPGETCCRKCGAYIDIPDELRVKKVESFQCSECGAEVPGDSNCCPRCGAKFDEEDETIVVKDDKKAETIVVENTATEEKEPAAPQEPAEEKKPEEQKKE